MCILFFTYGHEKYPLIMCNNRDEYFHRPTKRGTLYTASQLNHEQSNSADGERNIYFPMDLESKGSWIGVNGGNGKFVCVLNFHEWRTDEAKVLKVLKACGFARQAQVIPTPTSNVIATATATAPVQSTPAVYRSRGDLVRNYLLNDLTPEAQVAQLVGSDGCLEAYRGFNLIVGDSSNCFYLCNYSNNSNSSTRSHTLQRLDVGVVYGISNGLMESGLGSAEWMKVRTGRARMEELLDAHDPSEHSVEALADDLLRRLLLDQERQVDSVVEAAVEYEQGQKQEQVREGAPDSCPGVRSSDSAAAGSLLALTLNNLSSIYVHPTPLPDLFLSPPSAPAETWTAASSTTAQGTASSTGKLFGTRTSTVIVVEPGPLDCPGSSSGSGPTNALVLQCELDDPTNNSVSGSEPELELESEHVSVSVSGDISMDMSTVQEGGRSYSLAALRYRYRTLI